DVAQAVAQSDLVVVCTPVDHVAAEVLAAAPHGRATTLFTDVGSTKAAIVRAVDGRLPRGAFVGSHPLAGSEKRGPEHADPDLHYLTATGFRDTTRIASGDPSVWTGIFRHNRAAVLGALDRLGERLLLFRRALEADDPGALDQLLDQAKKVRDALGSCHPGQ